MGKSEMKIRLIRRHSNEKHRSGRYNICVGKGDRESEARLKNGAPFSASRNKFSD